ncbi:hypothetical protein ON010_g18262 [Phytophthora cinnamomi]|nr:hypothetical protein ON010_g18262 [Phytophthora cinnamomi]
MVRLGGVVGRVVDGCLTGGWVVFAALALRVEAQDGHEPRGVPELGQEEPDGRPAPGDHEAERPRERDPAQPGLCEGKELDASVVDREQQSTRNLGIVVADCHLACYGLLPSKTPAGLLSQEEAGLNLEPPMPRFRVLVADFV